MKKDLVSHDKGATLQEEHEREHRRGDVDIDMGGGLIGRKVRTTHRRQMPRRALGTTGGRARMRASGREGTGGEGEGKEGDMSKERNNVGD